MATLQSSNTANPGNSSSITVTKPTGLAVGDLMIFHYCFNDATDTANTISGWTHEVSNASAGGNEFTGLQWKVADSSDVAASNFTMSFSGVVGSPLAGLIRIDDYVSSDLLNDNRELKANTNSPSYNNTVTPLTSNNLLLFFAANNEAQTVSGQAIATNNPTWTEVYDITQGGVSGLSLASANRPEATATGNASLTIAGGSGTVDSLGIMVAIGTPVNASVSPTVLSSVISVQAPSVSGQANVSTNVISGTISVQAPTITLTDPLWQNTDKNSSSWNNLDKS